MKKILLYVAVLALTLVSCSKGSDFRKTDTPITPTSFYGVALGEEADVDYLMGDLITNLTEMSGDSVHFGYAADKNYVLIEYSFDSPFEYMGKKWNCLIFRCNADHGVCYEVKFYSWEDDASDIHSALLSEFTQTYGEPNISSIDADDYVWMYIAEKDSENRSATLSVDMAVMTNMDDKPACALQYTDLVSWLIYEEQD